MVRVAFRAPPRAPILIQQQRSFTDFLFQIDDTDNVDSDVPVEMGLLKASFGPDEMEEVATAEESRSSISMLLILNLNLGILF